MSYRFRLKETVPSGIRRIGREQINAVLQVLSQGDDINQSVHLARKRIKCIRSLLHLIRPGLEVSVFKAEDHRYRDIARHLSGARDAQVLLETLTTLEARSKIADTIILRDWLHDQHKEAERTLNSKKVGEVQDALLEGKKRFSKMVPKQIDFRDLAEGAKETYKCGRAGFLKAMRTQNGDHFHDWRKEAQRHWRHMQLLRFCWPGMIDMRARYVHELSQLLGDDHDLDVFGLMLEKNRAEFNKTFDHEALLYSTRKTQKSLRKLSTPHAQRLYAQRPKDFQQGLMTFRNASFE